MIEINDLVRFSNDYLSKGKMGLGNLHGRNYFKNRRRGKQIVSRVIRIVREDWDWRNKHYNVVVELDIPDRYACVTTQISTHWLHIVRKHNWHRDQMRNANP